MAVFGQPEPAVAVSNLSRSSATLASADPTFDIGDLQRALSDSGHTLYFYLPSPGASCERKCIDLGADDREPVV